MRLKLKYYVIFFLFFILASKINSQYIKVENYQFKVVNYTLIEDVLSYRIYDYTTKECTSGGEMDSIDFYEWTFLSRKKGKYVVVIYQKPNNVLIRETVEVK